MKIQCNLLPRTYPGPYYSINVETVGPGSVSILPIKSFYELGDIVTITATPAVGYDFITWRKDSISTNNILTFTVNSDINLVARFRKPQAVRVLISDFDPVHGGKVRDSFLQAYLDCTGGAYAGTYELRLIGDGMGSPEPLENALIYADEVGAEILIRSTTGWNYTLARDYYPTFLVMPGGTNVHTQQNILNGNLPPVLLTGCGTVSNLNAYDIEIFNNDMYGTHLNSFANPYTAGVIVAAVDSSFNNAGFNDYAAARYYLRKGKVYDNENGYGFLDYADLTKAANVNEYLANVAIDPEFYRKLDQYLLL